MPNYRDPLGKLGAAVGAGGAGGISRLLEMLDYPRQALWNLPGKLAEGDWLGALPGLAGAGAGLATALTGAGLPFASLIGSAVGGGAQGFGRALDEERFEAPTGESLTGEPVSGMLLSMLGDPLMYAGGLGGRQAGRAYGGRLENIATHMGPEYGNYPGKLEELMRYPSFKAMGGEAQERIRGHLGALAQSPQLDRIMNEIPVGSYPIGSGVEAVALKRPDKGVVLVSRPSEVIDEILGANMNAPPQPRVDIPEMLLAARSIPFKGVPSSDDLLFGEASGYRSPFRVEHVPEMEFARNLPPTEHGLFGEAAHRLAKSVKDTSPDLRFWDAHLGNVGRSPAGEYFITDAGAIAKHVGSEPLGKSGIMSDTLGPLTGLPEKAGMPGTDIERQLLRLFYAPQQVRRELLEALGQYPPGLKLPGRPGQSPASLESHSPEAKAVLDRLWARLQPKPLEGGLPPEAQQHLDAMLGQMANGPPPRLPGMPVREMDKFALRRAEELDLPQSVIDQFRAWMNQGLPPSSPVSSWPEELGASLF